MLDQRAQVSVTDVGHLCVDHEHRETVDEREAGEC